MTTTPPLFAVDVEDSSDAWYTPPWIFDGLGVEFDVDVCSPPFELPWIPARRRYTAADDGLSQPWYGLVWCNPPYSSPREWAMRWSRHDDGLLLIRSDLSTAGPIMAFAAADAVYVSAKRIRFVDGAGKPAGAANFSAVLLARGRAAVESVHRLSERCGGIARALGQIEGAAS